MKMKTNRYIYPYFGNIELIGFRIGGAGLGNLLFCLSRALCLSNKYNLQLINPTWPSIKFGPWLRNEKDKRSYIGLFKPIGISGFNKYISILYHKKISENEYDPTYFNGYVLLISGLGNYFQDFKHEHSYIKGQLLNMMSDHTKHSFNNFKGFGVGIHLRLGDFTNSNRIKTYWHQSIIMKIMNKFHKDIPVYLFTDGKDDEPEVKDILKIRNSVKINLGNPLAEIFALSKCAVILASNSTFSAWASFIGQNPTIWNKRDKELEGINLNDTIFNGIIYENEEFPDQLTKNLTDIFSER